jgi:MFS transporter, DHA1 family, tetracycline resistance protein
MNAPHPSSTLTEASRPGQLTLSTMPPLWPLILASLLGSMAFMALNAIFGPALRLFGLPDWQAGAILSIAGIFMMISGGIWGRLSNRIGRKNVLMTGLLGVGLSLFVLAWVVQAGFHQLIPVAVLGFGLLAARSSMSYFYASISVAAQAWVADHSEPVMRSKPMAALGAGQGLGMILGPALAAIISTWGLVLPFWLTGLLPLFGLVMVWFFMAPSRLPPTKVGKTNLSVLDKRLRRPLLTAFVCMFVIMTAQLTIGFLAIDLLKLAPKAAAGAAGAALASVGVAFFLAQMVVSRLGWQPRRLARFGAPIAALGFGLTPLLLPQFPHVAMMCAGFFTSALGLGFIWSAFQTGSTIAVTASEVGEATGHTASAMGAATVIGPLVAGALYSVSPIAPYAFDSLMLIGLFFLWQRDSIH